MYKIGSIIRISDARDGLKVGDFYIITGFYPPFTQDTSNAPNCKMHCLRIDPKTLERVNRQSMVHTRSVTPSSQCELATVYRGELQARMDGLASELAILARLVPYWQLNGSCSYSDILKNVAADLVMSGKESESLRLLMDSRDSRFGYDGGPLNYAY